MRKILNEVTKAELINQSRNGADYSGDQSKGKNRFQRRVHSKISPSVKEYNEIDMNKLFKDNILDVGIVVNGETNTYLVRVSFVGLLDAIQEELDKTGSDKVDPRIIQRSLVKSINDDDKVMISCTCEDFKYRFGFWANKGDFLNQNPNNNYDPIMLNDSPVITNPMNNKGRACKHILLVLNNLRWLMKVTSVIYNYVNYMEKHYNRLYVDVIYPALYGKEYTDDVQTDLDLFGTGDELATSKDDIDISNKYARTKNQFKKGNKSGIRFTKDEPEKQLKLDDLVSDTEA